MVVINLENINIGFKSNEEFYKIEQLGKKNNTVREIDWDDSRFLTLALMKHHDSYGLIRIVSTGTDKESFERRIKNVCIWNDLMIITWKN